MVFAICIDTRVRAPDACRLSRDTWCSRRLRVTLSIDANAELPAIDSATKTDDATWMRAALAEAERAAAVDEVPVGAVLVGADGSLLAAGHNQPIGSCDPSAHAEMIVLREAARRLGNYRLPGTTLYVTVEPCTMCVGAIVHARVGRVVYGATEPKTGAIESAQRLFETGEFNHRPEITGGVLAGECGAILSAFFAGKRNKS